MDAGGENIEGYGALTRGEFQHRWGWNIGKWFLSGKDVEILTRGAGLKWKTMQC